MTNLDSIYKYGAIRQIVKNPRKAGVAWIISQFFGNTKYAKDLGRIAGLYAKVRIVLFLLYLLFLLFIVLVVVGIVRLLAR